MKAARLSVGIFPIGGRANICRLSLSSTSKGAPEKPRLRRIFPNTSRLKGYRVLAVDLDPQASLSALHGYQPEFDIGPNETLYGAIRYDNQRRPLSEIVQRTYFPGLDIVPGNIELMEFEHDTPAALAKKDGENAFFFTRMDEALSGVSDRYDVVVVDCPPQLGFLTLSALCSATAVLVTVHPQMLDVMSMCQFLIMTSDLLSVVARSGREHEL